MELTGIMSVCCVTVYISSTALKDESEIQLSLHTEVTCTYVHF